MPCAPALAGRTRRAVAHTGNYLASRMTIDSGGRLMPETSEDALAVPWTMFELAAFWSPAL